MTEYSFWQVTIRINGKKTKYKINHFEPLSCRQSHGSMLSNFWVTAHCRSFNLLNADDSPIMYYKANNRIHTNGKNKYLWHSVKKYLFCDPVQMSVRSEIGVVLFRLYWNLFYFFLFTFTYCVPKSVLHEWVVSSEVNLSRAMQTKENVEK